MHTKKTAPKHENSGLFVDDLGSADTVEAVTVPTGAIRVRLWFQNSAGSAKVVGRVGFGGNEPTAAAVDTALDPDTLGWQDTEAVDYWIPSWAKQLFLCSSTANADVFGMWFYD